MRIFRENQRWWSSRAPSNNALHYFLLNLASITLMNIAYDGLQEIDPPGVIQSKLRLSPWKRLKKQTISQASLIKWVGSGKKITYCTKRSGTWPNRKCVESMPLHKYVIAEILQ